MEARLLSILSVIFAFACGHAADSDVLERLAFAPGGWIYGYDEINYDIDEDDALTVNYYDNYGFLDLFPGRKADLSYRSKSGYGGRFVSPLDDRSSAVGMLTGRLTACGDSVMVESFYYDHAGRMVQRHSTNHLGGYEHVYLALSFTGNPVRELREHAGGGAETVSVLREYEYDGRDRLVKVTHRIGGGETRVLLKNSYDEVGRLAAVETNGGSYRTDYGYNVRGWLTEISSPNLDQTLRYETVHNGSTPCWNGNISSITSDNKQPMPDGSSSHGGSTTAYLYDGMGRLTAARYAMLGAPSDPFYRGDHSSSYAYDLNSNIVSLVRKGQRDRLGDGEEILFNGFGTIDSLAVMLDGNRLLKVTDNMEEVVYGDAFDFHDGADEDVEYEYDANGNMTVDLNRGIKEIEYDVSNRPLSVTFSTRPAEQRTKYLYDASGRKLRTTYQTSRYASLGPDDLVHVDTLELNPDIWDHIETGVLRPLSSPGIGEAVERRDDGKVLPAEEALWSTSYVRDYCGDIIYKDGEVERILTDNGYVVPDSAGGYDYYYYVKDWQGNVRAVIDEANRRMELNNYYPYGMPMSSTASVQPYKYGCKELDRTNGLDMYDYGARWYDMIVPHFITIDPMAEKNCSVSPYSYCGGNPINRVDPTGMDEWEINKRGEIVNRIKTKEHDAFYIVDNKGNRSNSISFAHGTIANSFTEKMKGGGSYDAYNISGDKNGTHLFEFLAKNTDVEWSKLSYGTSGNLGLNVLTTSHGTSSEGGMTNYVSKYVPLPYIIRRDTHSHPGNTPYPSGLTQSNFGDVQYAKELTNMFRQNISFSIFLPDKNSYIQYSPNSTIYDYPELSPIMKTLDEIIVGY